MARPRDATDAIASDGSWRGESTSARHPARAELPQATGHLDEHTDLGLGDCRPLAGSHADDGALFRALLTYVRDPISSRVARRSPTTATSVKAT
jgi:hypothetical protein